ncbi:DUF4892 domain-containing protein [Hydrogenophaga sp. 5NK40-0174]|uniref:OmpA family protein n=1 Tax=Hydrogenophaga sp. 5NK40-0174 TaxID=3127649 RepID=UPI003102CC55
MFHFSAFDSRRLLMATALALSAFTATAADVNGAEDHPLISRFPGSDIVSYYTSEFNEIRFPDRAAKEDKPPSSFVTAAGRHTAIVYRAPKGKTTAELMRNFRDAMKTGKAQVLLECKGGECDGTSSWHAAKFFKTIFSREHKGGNGPDDHYFPLDAYNADQRYLVAKLSTPDGANAFVEIGMVSKADGPVHISVEVVEEEAVQSGQVSLNLDTLTDKMASDGRVPFYGIRFDTGRATLRPESTAELSLLTQYLQANPKLRVYIVGHTDDTGDFSANQTLSQARAEAVMSHLKAQKIDPQRLMARGVGSLSPVASNRDEKGRELNRRVEVVERLR